MERKKLRIRARLNKTGGLDFGTAPGGAKKRLLFR